MNCLLIYPCSPPSYWSYTNTLRHHSAKTVNYPLGLLTVAALLPEDWQVRLIDLNVKNVSEADWDWAGVVMLSGMHIHQDGILTLLTEAKQRRKTTVCGGPYATLVPEKLIAGGCDYVVCGEAETGMLELLGHLSQRQTGTIIRPEKRCDLKHSPIPRFELIDLKDYLNLMVQTTRGCPYNCEFCNIASLYGRAVRWKSPDQVIGELERLHRLGGRGPVLIADDNFIANRNNAKAICRELIRWNRDHGEPFGFLTQVTTDLGQDLEMIDLMTAANFGEVFIGIETLDEQALINSNKHQNIRNPLAQSVAAIKENGLSVIGSFILGFDNEEKGAGNRIREFVEQTDIPTVMLNMLNALPQTELWNRLEEEGRISPQTDQHETGELFASLPNFITARPIEEIAEEYIRMWDRLYEPSAFFERCYRFCLAVRPTRRTIALEKGQQTAEKHLQAAPIPLKNQLADLRVLVHHVWTYGVISPIRVQFWKQLFGMYKHNPSRLRKYIVHCIQGHEMIFLRDVVIRQLSQKFPSISNPQQHLNP